MKNSGARALPVGAAFHTQFFDGLDPGVDHGSGHVEPRVEQVNPCFFRKFDEDQGFAILPGALKREFATRKFDDFKQG